MLKRTHRPFFQRPLFLLHFLLPSSSYILTVAPLVIPPLRSLFPRSAAVACVYSAREREGERGPREGTMASFRKTIDPMAEQRKSAWGPANTPSTNFTAIRHRAFAQTHPRMSRRQTHTSDTPLLSFSLHHSLPHNPPRTHSPSLAEAV